MQNYIRTICSLLALACFSMAAHAITLTGVQLRKSHGGTPLDIPVDIGKNISGAVTIESRAIGAGHQIVFQFDTGIMVPATVSVTDESGAAVALAPPVANGNEVSVTIPSLADAKRVAVQLTSVNGSVGSDFVAAIGFLIGDTNNSGTVTAADASQVKSRAGQLADASNAKFDLNTSGAVNAADITTVKARQSRMLLPAYTLGGSVSGLTGTLVLQNNGGNTVTITANGSYTFPVAATGAYNVTVITQPAGQTCTFTNNVGTIASASVTNISVSCVTVQVTTIYDIKRGWFALGTLVQLNNQLVTGIKAGSGFFLQMKSGDPSYFLPEFSGLFVFTSGPLAFSVGNRVDVAGAVQVFNGEIQLAANSISVVSALSETLPLPVLVANASDIATGGPLSQILEGVIARVANVQVTAQNSGAGEFTVGGVLVVDDFLFLRNPLPNPGDVFQSLTGIVATKSNVNKLLPSSNADFDFVVPTLTFGPTGMFINVGSNGPTFPTALTVSLGTPAFGDTFVPITSSNQGSLSVQGGGVTVPNGQSSATVILTGIAQNASVTLTALVSGQMLTSTVRVLGPAEQPALVSLTPPAATIHIGGGSTFTVTLDIPAPIGGTLITLSLNPANAGAIPATVTVPANQLTASFSYADAGIVGSAQITATRGATTRNATLTMTNSGQFVINEVDYDQIGPDTASFVELYNGTGSAIDLTGLALVLVNGSNNTEYARYDLGLVGTVLAAGQYLVVANTNVTVAGGSIKFVPPGVANTDFIQNGAPDGIALINTATLTVLDSFSYAGSITMANIAGFSAPVNLVRGTALLATTADSNTASGSLCRFPNGTRTDNDATDWRLCTTTPGAANLP